MIITEFYDFQFPGKTHAFFYRITNIQYMLHEKYINEKIEIVDSANNQKKYCCNFKPVGGKWEEIIYFNGNNICNIEINNENFAHCTFVYIN